MSVIPVDFKRRLSSTLHPRIGGYAVLRRWATTGVTGSEFLELIQDRGQALGYAWRELPDCTADKPYIHHIGDIEVREWVSVEPVTLVLFRLVTRAYKHFVRGADAEWLSRHRCFIAGQPVFCVHHEAGEGVSRAGKQVRRPHD